MGGFNPGEMGQGNTKPQITQMNTDMDLSIRAGGSHSDHTLQTRPMGSFPHCHFALERPLTFGVEGLLIDSCLAITLAGLFLAASVAEGLR
jgi:hypothetical protein